MSIAKSLRCTPAQATYKIAQMHGIVPLSGTTDEEHMREDVAVEQIELANGIGMDRNIQSIKNVIGVS